MSKRGKKRKHREKKANKASKPVIVPASAKVSAPPVVNVIQATSTTKERLSKAVWAREILVLTSPLSILLISLPLIVFMIWVLAWVLRIFHKLIEKFILRNLELWPGRMFNYLLQHNRALYITLVFVLIWLLLSVFSLSVESYRVGQREALATAVRLAIYVVNAIYTFFKLVAEGIWIPFGFVLTFMSKEDWWEEFKDKVANGISAALKDTR